jgi:cation diffusion facilitator CzcD-associated flavoprotein CzcO
MVHRLRDLLGLDVRGFEAADDVGGTWYWNRYPGARCDSDSYIYCYSFSPELLRDWEWSGRYPEQPEILEYLRHVADRFGLRRSYCFGTRVNRATYDEAASCWRVETDGGEHIECRFLVTAVGILASAPYVPALPGLSCFAGDWYHTGRWPHQSVDFKDKNVAVIGTGSTGVQAIPVIARQAKHLDVFQRTPQYAIPTTDEALSAEFRQWINENYQEIFQKARWSVGGFPWEHNGKRAIDATPEERAAEFETLWQNGGLKFILGSYRDILTDRRANDLAAEFVRSKIRKIVDDPAVADALLPVSYPIAARRPITDTGYFETFNRPDVTLHDCTRDPIEEVTSKGIRTASSEYPVDIIVFATGFDGITGPFKSMDVVGRDGESLLSKWSRGPASYLGLAVSNFPNMFTVVGPGAMLGNYPISMEHHVEWIETCIRYLTEHGFKTIEASASAEREWMERLEREASHTLIWLADSWYTGANIPGKPRATYFYFGNFARYRSLCEEAATNGYVGFELA